MAESADDPGGLGRPDPLAPDTPAAFVEALRRLQRWSGLSYREVEKRAADAGTPLPRSTLTTAFSRSTLPRELIVVALVRACGGDDDEVARWVATRRRLAAAPEQARTADAAPQPPLPAAVPAAVPAVGPPPRPVEPPGPRRAVAARRRVLLGFGASTLALVGGWLLLSPLDGSTDSDVRPAAASTALPAAADQACPDGWFCLYEHPNFNRQTAGRMLKFRDGYWQPLRDHSFEEQTSSVQNRLTRESCLSAGWPADGRTIAVPAGADRPTLSGWEDRASGLKAGPCRSRGGEPTASSSQQFRASAQQPR